MKTTVLGTALRAAALAVLLSPPMAQAQDRPACKALEAVFVELGKRSGEVPTDAQVKEAVYGENPTNADCQAMLALFPKIED